jgi:hypothetical protein
MITAAKPPTAWVLAHHAQQEQKEGTERYEWPIGYIVSAARQDRSVPGGIRETSRRVDHAGRALVAPDFKAKEANTARKVASPYA